MIMHHSTTCTLYTGEVSRFTPHAAFQALPVGQTGYESMDCEGGDKCGSGDGDSDCDGFGKHRLADGVPVRDSLESRLFVLFDE